MRRLALLLVLCPATAAAQTDSASTVDSSRTRLTPISVTATRTDLAPAVAPLAISVVTGNALHRARPTWGLDESLAGVPGVFVANRYNFSVDQRVSIRGFGARSAFAVRGVKVIVDGIPQTLPDGQGQLTNLDFGTVERIEVIRGSSSALHGNASGGVISIWTGDPVPSRWTQEARVTYGTFDRRFDRSWSKWQAGTAFRVGAGGLRISVSRFAYEGERNYSNADFRYGSLRWSSPLGAQWNVYALADLGDQPRADNPGALTAAELAVNRDSAAAINLTTRAGKDVRQAQGGLTLQGRFRSGEVALTVFGLARDLDNPQTFAYIQLDRRAGGARLTASRVLSLAGRPFRTVAGVDLQHQRDDRTNFGTSGGMPTATRTLDQVERVTEAGPFLQATWQLLSRGALTAGVRHDWVRFAAADRLITGTNPDDSGNRTQGALSGTLGLTWRASDAAVLYATAGSSFETPTTTELANRPTGAGGFNDSLGPQRAWNFEAGARWSSERLRAELAAFNALIEDGLVPFEVPAAPQRRFFRNAAQSTLRGVEASLDAAVTPWLTMAGSYSLSDFTYRSYTLPVGARRIVLDGRAVPGIPKHRARVAGTARRGSLWTELESIHTASVLVDDTLATRAAAWWHVNVRAGWDGRVAGWTLQPFVAVQNALDRRYVGSVVINAAGGRYYEPAPRRNLYFGVVIRTRGG